MVGSVAPGEGPRPVLIVRTAPPSPSRPWAARHPPTGPTPDSGCRSTPHALFTVSELGLPAPLRRCLGTTNVIDNAHSGMRQRMWRVTRWCDGSMVVRWAAAAFLDAEENYRRIMGYKDIWILKAHLDESSTSVAKKEGSVEGGLGARHRSSPLAADPGKSRISYDVAVS